LMRFLYNDNSCSVLAKTKQLSNFRTVFYMSDTKAFYYVSLGTILGLLLLLRFVLSAMPTKVFERIDSNPRLNRVPTVEKNTQTQIAKPQKKDFSILFAGDMMFDRHVRTIMQKQGADFVFQGIVPLVSPVDTVVANLEGPITQNASISQASKIGEHANFYFTFDPAITPLLSKYHFFVLNIGNNHILNFGDEGLGSTKTNLASQNISYFGSPDGDNTSIVKEIGGTKIAFVSYNQFSKVTAQKTLEDLQNVFSQADFTVVYTHWGKEYETVPQKNQTDLAHNFVDSGADVVIGSHPHVVQSVEKYKDKYIFYSLGNFIFDQYFQKETMEGLAVKVECQPASGLLRYSLIPVQIANNGQTTPMNSEKSNLFLQNLAKSSNMSQDIITGSFSGAF